MHDDTAVPVTTEKPGRPRNRGISTLSLMLDPRNWAVWIVVIACAAVFAGQVRGLVLLEDWAFSGAAMQEGRWWTLFSSMFLHAWFEDFPALGYVHIASNMWAYLTLAPLVIARFGRSLGAIVIYHIFYVLCGLAGGLVFWLMSPVSDLPVVGASGAVYGVYAALMRLDIFNERVRPFFSRTTIDAIWFFIWSNAIVILLFGGPAALIQLAQGQVPTLDTPIAWQAHLGGFVAGYLLIALMGGRAWKNNWKAGITVVRLPSQAP